MKNNIIKTTLFFIAIIGFQHFCFAGDLQTLSGSNNSMLTLLIAFVAFIFSLISLIMVFRIKRQNQVDLVNATEDMHLTVDSLKTTLSKDIKNVRKEINRNFRRDNHHGQHSQATSDKSTGESDQTKENRPSPGRRLPHKKHYSRGRGQMPQRRPENETPESE